MCASSYLPAHCTACRGDQHPCLSTISCIGDKTQPVKATHIGPHHADFSDFRNLEREFVTRELAHEEGRALIDEPLGDAIVQRIRKPIFDAASTILPCRRILNPIIPMGDIRPGTNMCDARH